MASRTLTYAGFQLQRVLTNPMNLFFSMVLPALLYVFINAGNGVDGVEYDTGANLSAELMVGFALFGGITAVVAGGANGVVNSLTGWGRQLALTPLTETQIAISDILEALFRVTLPVTAVFIIGAFTGAEMHASTWVLTYVLCIVCSIPFTCLGMSAASISPTPSTIGIASAAVSFLAFIGNLFIPLTGDWAVASRFTPLWGPGILTRYPVFGNAQRLPGEAGATQSDVIAAVINFVVWSAFFFALYLMLSRRDKNRL